MAIAVLSKLGWSVGQKTQAGIAAELNVSSATVSRYLTGIREIPQWRFSQIERMYERTQYEIVRFRGLAPDAASKYRGLLPDTFDSWIEKLEDLKVKWSEGHTASRLVREDIDLADLAPGELDDIYDEEYDKLTQSIDQTGKDIGELEAYA